MVLTTNTSIDESCLMAKQIEKEIYVANHNQVNNEYKESIRSHVYNLRDTKNPLRQHVLSGSISPTELAHMVKYSLNVLYTCILTQRILDNKRHG